MMDRLRRQILKTGVAATVMAAAPRVFAQQTGQGDADPSFYEEGNVHQVGGACYRSCIP